MKEKKEIIYRVLIGLIPVLMLVACGPGQEEPPATATAESAVEPTETPQPDSGQAEPTAAAASISSQAGGTAGFRDNLATADQFVLELNGLSDAPEGQLYEGWLLGEDGSVINVGELNVEGDGTVSLTWNSPDSENLLGRFTRFQVTVETSAGSDAPSGPVIVAGGLDAETLAVARRFFVKNSDEPATPLDTAFATGLIAQTEVAVQHVQNASNAAAIGALPEMGSHLEHVVNIIEGAAGSRFGDHNGNGSAENPGDGFGVIGYAEQIAALLSARPVVVEAAAAVQEQSAAIQDMCLEILELEDMAAASTQLADLNSLADELRVNQVAALYQVAQTSIDFEVTAVEE